MVSDWFLTGSDWFQIGFRLVFRLGGGSLWLNAITGNYVLLALQIGTNFAAAAVTAQITIIMTRPSADVRPQKTPNQNRHLNGHQNGNEI